MDDFGKSIKKVKNALDNSQTSQETVSNTLDVIEKLTTALK